MVSLKLSSATLLILHYFIPKSLTLKNHSPWGGLWKKNKTKTLQMIMEYYECVSLLQISSERLSVSVSVDASLLVVCLTLSPSPSFASGGFVPCNDTIQLATLAMSEGLICCFPALIPLPA